MRRGPTASNTSRWSGSAVYWAIAAAATAAVADWMAVAKANDRVESIAKAAVMVGLIVAVVAAGDTGWSERLLLAALVLSLVGDVLLLPKIDWFVGGLAAFLVGHVFYSGAFLAAGIDPAGIIAGVALVLAIVVLGMFVIAVGGRIVAGANREDERLGRAVRFYIAVISLMVSLGLGVGVVVAVGAVLFAASDSVLGRNRFVAPLPHGRLATHIPYHLGQGLIVRQQLSDHRCQG